MFSWARAERRPRPITRHEAFSRRELYKRRGKWCSYCDFLPVCLGDKKKVKEGLVKIT
jgi:hypothetical protein